MDFAAWHQELRADARLRDESFGPVLARAYLLRDYADAMRDLADLVAVLPQELELIDQRLVAAFGRRWWERTEYNHWTDWRSSDA